VDGPVGKWRQHDANATLLRTGVDEIDERSGRLVRGLVAGEGERSAVGGEGERLNEPAARPFAQLVLTEPLAGRCVKDRDRARGVPDGKQAPVGAHRHRVDLRIPGATQNAEHRRRGAQ
jgi:hypothetical protein